MGYKKQIEDIRKRTPRFAEVKQKELLGGARRIGKSKELYEAYSEARKEEPKFILELTERELFIISCKCGGRIDQLSKKGYFEDDRGGEYGVLEAVKESFKNGAK